MGKFLEADCPQYALDFYNKVAWFLLDEKTGRAKVKQMRSVAFSLLGGMGKYKRATNESVNVYQGKRFLEADCPQYALDFLNDICWSRVPEVFGRAKIAELEKVAFTLGGIPKR